MTLDPAITAPWIRSSCAYPRALTHGVHAHSVPPRPRKSSINPFSGSRGLTCVVSTARLRARSTAALVRKTYTFNPAVIPPFAIVNPTDDNSWSVPFVINTTSSLA